MYDASVGKIQVTKLYGLVNVMGSKLNIIYFFVEIDPVVGPN